MNTENRPIFTESHFTWHALRRCLERGISQQQVEQAVLCGHMSLQEGSYLYTHGRLQVVLSPAGLVVTAFRRSKRNPKRRLRQKRKERARQGR